VSEFGEGGSSKSYLGERRQPLADEPF
jgi:hypothetical protein